tara:strand:- start:364 stop:951 length:588 start_codon:yes stop_codon:yes gene_type:complete
VKAAREEAKAKGLPDPKPRKKRASKKDMANTAAPADNSKIAPIDSAPPAAVNDVAAKPVDPSVTKSTPIDVPNLPGEGKKVASKKDIVKDPEAVPEAAPKKGISSAGVPTDYKDNEAMRSGSADVLKQTMEFDFPGQKDAIKKELGEKDKPLAPAPKPARPSKTVEKVKTHVPDVKATEGRAPFSFSAIRKVLYQ